MENITKLSGIELLALRVLKPATAKAVRNELARRAATCKATKLAA